MNHHIANQMMTANADGLTELEERFCYHYMCDERFRGKPEQILLEINYSSTLSDHTPKRELQQVAETILARKHVKRRLESILAGRDGQFVYDKKRVLDAYERMLTIALGEDLQQEDGETDEEFKKRLRGSVDLKNGKAIADSMAKTMGMHQIVEVQKDEAEDPSAKIRAANERSKKRRAELRLVKQTKANGTD